MIYISNDKEKSFLLISSSKTTLSFFVTNLKVTVANLTSNFFSWGTLRPVLTRMNSIRFLLFEIKHVFWSLIQQFYNLRICLFYTFSFKMHILKIMFNGSNCSQLSEILTEPLNSWAGSSLMQFNFFITDVIFINIGHKYEWLYSFFEKLEQSFSTFSYRGRNAMLCFVGKQRNWLFATNSIFVKPITL